MIKNEEIKNIILKLFSNETLQSMSEEYGFKFNFEKGIKTVAYATNLTPFTIQKAAQNNADLLITHHDAWSFMKEQREHCLNLLKTYKLNHCFFHIPLDAAEFGTSASLANELGVQDIKFTVPYCNLFVGVAGQIKNQSFEEFTILCQNVLKEKVRFFKNNEKPVSKILVVAGAGNETTNLDSVLKENCDTYVTGEYGMYLQHYAEFHKINLIIGSHTKTEIIGVRNFVKKILYNLKNIKLIEIDEPSF